MKIDKNQILNELRILFFQNINKGSTNFYYGTLVETLLSFVKERLGLEEVSYFRFDDWKQQFYLDATSNKKIKELQKSLTISSSLIEKWNLNENDCCFLSEHSFVEFKDYQAIISIQVEQKVLGFIVFKEKTIGTFAHSQKKEWFAFFQEFTHIFKTMVTFCKVNHEEKKYEKLYRVTEKFHSSMSMDAVLGEIIATLQSVYPSFDYYLLLSHDNNSHENLPIKDLEYDSQNEAAMQAFVTGTVQFEDKLSERTSVLHAPLKGKQGVYGVLQVIAADTVMLPDSEIEFITLLANTAGSALENAQLYQQSKQLVSDLQFINETTRYLNTNLRLNETIQFMKKQIKKSFNANQICFVIISNDGKINLLPGSSKFFGKPEADFYLSFTRAKIEKEKDSLFIGDLSAQFPDENIEYHSLIAVPMLGDRQITGFAIVLQKEPYYFSFDMFKLLQSLIHHSSLAMANSILREELEKMVITDHLTQLHSRNYLDKQMGESMQADEEGTFILIDIDNFKKVNDTYGHQIGDEILVQVANLIHSNIRETDIGARWGGEELAIYLPKVPLVTGVQIAERLKDAVAEKSNPKITISCGVSHWSKVDCSNPIELFRRADEALYDAKRSGKNKVMVKNCSC